MEPDSGLEPLSFLGKRLPRSFRTRVVRIDAGCSLPYRQEDWADAIVVVEQGSVEVECPRGGSRTFCPGAVVFMTGLDLKAMHNRGDETVVLAAVSRAPP
jgi:quercetin dioxygenase-like cupin family protein